MISKKVGPDESWAIAPVEGGNGRPHQLGQGDELFGFAGTAVDAYPLFNPVDVRRGEQARSISGSRQRGGKHGRGRALALGAGDVDDGQILLWAAQFFQESARIRSSPIRVAS